MIYSGIIRQQIIAMRSPIEKIDKEQIDKQQLEKEQLANEQLSHALLSWQPELVGTLVYVLRDNPATHQGEVLLIEKLRGHGQGLINGPGGKLEPGETVFECARRELLEEVGIRAGHLTLQAHIRFVDLQGPQWLGFVFTTREFVGSPRASSEANPTWYGIQQLPWQQMWPSDGSWLPTVLAETQVEANLLFDAGQLLVAQVLASANLRT